MGFDIEPSFIGRSERCDNVYFGIIPRLPLFRILKEWLSKCSTRMRKLSKRQRATPRQVSIVQLNSVGTPHDPG
jgi:hypothetical protein